MSLEKFKRIEGYDGRYLVSSWGFVYCNIALDTARENGVDIVYKPLNAEETSKGYLRVPLFKDGKRKWHKVHRLVAQAFIPNPENKPQVNHIDGNKQNNSITNLEWVTDAENKEHYKQITDKEKPYAN